MPPRIQNSRIQNARRGRLRRTRKVGDALPDNVMQHEPERRDRSDRQRGGPAALPIAARLFANVHFLAPRHYAVLSGTSRPARRHAEPDDFHVCGSGIESAPIPFPRSCHTENAWLRRAGNRFTKAHRPGAAAPDLERTGSPGGLIDAAHIPPRDRRRGVGRGRRDRALRPALGPDSSAGEVGALAYNPSASAPQRHGAGGVDGAAGFARRAQDPPARRYIGQGDAHRHATGGDGRLYPFGLGGPGRIQQAAHLGLVEIEGSSQADTGCGLRPLA